MFQAITTRYLGPTDHRGARIKAQAAAGQVVHNWDYALNSSENHRAAALLLCRQLGWEGEIAGGVVHDGSYAFVFVGPVTRFAYR